jgi:uncharacterized membrane protein YkoI
MSSRHVRLAFLLLSSLLVLALAAGSATAGSAATKPPASRAKAAAHVRRATGSDSLAGQAKISEATARATALAKVPGGRIKAHELERENGLLIHSFDIVVPGAPGIEEVNVNAMDGTVVEAKHENAAAERREAKQDRAEKAARHPARKVKTAPRDSAKAH